MKKIVSILGARPQFIKAAAVSRAIKKYPEIKEIIVHTGQHFDQNMSDIFFKEMDIPSPNYNLKINSLSHGAMTGRMLEKIEHVLFKEKPDLVLVYGDTNSTLAGSLAARKLNIDVAHVEAGLRSFNMAMPEEINRILTDRISHYLFCPTETAVNNLKTEGFENFNCQIHRVGDVMYDAAMYYKDFSQKKSKIISQLSLKQDAFVLCTIHRQENTDDLDRLNNIVNALNEVNKQTRVVLPLHPRTRKIIAGNKIRIDFDPIGPVGYFDIIELLKNCRLVFTDSGGMQKEAYFFEKFCITLRDETEWTELVEHKVNYLAGASKKNILETYHKLLSMNYPDVHSLYGEGNASECILDKILK